MSTLLVILALTAPGEPTKAPDSASSVSKAAQSDRTSKPAKPRKYHELSKDVSRLLQSEARSASAADRAELVHEMCALFNEVVRDPRFDTSEALEELRGRLAGRLRKIQRELTKDLTGKRKPGKSPNSRQLPEQQQDQQQQATRDAANSLTAQLAIVGATMGGPASLFSQQGGGAFGGGRADDGEALVELIQRTIHPDFWDVNGGPGTIMYYAPLHALVVRATDEIHGDVGGLARGLRAAGE